MPSPAPSWSMLFCVVACAQGQDWLGVWVALGVLGGFSGRHAWGPLACTPLVLRDYCIPAPLSCQQVHAVVHVQGLQEKGGPAGGLRGTLRVHGTP